MHSPCHRTFSLKRVAGLSFPARVERAQFHRARSASKKDGLAAPFISFRGCCLLTVSSRWGLNDLLLRASNEGSPRPRVARAQKIISLRPLLCSGSTGSIVLPHSSLNPSTTGCLAAQRAGKNPATRAAVSASPTACRINPAGIVI